MRRACLLASTLLLSATGCLDTAAFDDPDGSGDLSVDAPPPPAPRILAVIATDHEGRSWPLDALPRQPILEVQASAWVGAEEPFLFVFQGALDPEELADDLRRPPLLSRHATLALPVEVEGLTLRPPRLEAGTPYTVAVAGWARDASDRPLEAPFVAHLRVARVAAGAAITDSWPADGTAGAPYDIPLVALRFDDLVRGEDIALVGANGAVAGQLQGISCEEVGWESGDCRAFSPGGPLRPDATYRIEVGEGVVDRSGAPVGPWQAIFHTGSEPQRPPTFLALECQIDEYPAGSACVLADDRALVLRAQLDVPVRAFLAGASVRDGMVANRGEVRLQLAPLVAGSRFEAELRLEGLGGESHTERLTLQATDELATLTIAEVRSDPLGTEPRQEYVEVLNFGPSPVVVTGLALADRPDRIGDVIETAQSIPPGARALLVADAFDPDDPADAPVPPGAMLVRLGTSLASAGLSNAGEALYLRDAEGRRLSAAPPTSTGAGSCLVRRGSVREGDEAAFEIGECTPGTAPR